MEKTFLSKKGNTVLFRPFKLSDIEETLSYINKISKEDTFICLSGEEITRDQEEKFLKETEQEFDEKKTIRIGAFLNGKLIGLCDIKKERQRASHVGVFGITIAKEFRQEGIGSALMDYVIKLAKDLIGIKIVRLGVFANNPGALHLYGKMGFLEFGKLPGGILYKGDYIDHILLYKQI